MPIFPHERVLEIHAAAIQCGLARSRNELLVGLDLSFVSRLPLTAAPAGQLLSDLAALNRSEETLEGTLPLKTWLDNALLLAGIRAEGEIFRRASSELAARSPETGRAPRRVEARPAPIGWRSGLGVAAGLLALGAAGGRLYSMLQPSGVVVDGGAASSAAAAEPRRPPTVVAQGISIPRPTALPGDDEPLGPEEEPVPSPPCPLGMMHIPGGTFMMGSPAGEEGISSRQVRVQLSAFCMDRSEVTVAQYQRCVDEPKGARGCTTLDLRLNDHVSCNWGRRGRAQHPINCVSWTQANDHCRWADKTLPSEAQWEYVARGGDEQRRYPWGVDPPLNQLCWGGPGSARSKLESWASCPVGLYRQGDSRWGLHDMAGNVSEWTADVFVGEYDLIKLADRTGGILVDPRHTEASSPPSYVVRGSGWNASVTSDVRNSVRLRSQPSERTENTGFRCALDLR